MRSKEVAEFAGVTVRTLRHYHQLGILPEPPRSANGYREYGAVDVARVLRIKRLASLGFSLEQVGAMLNREQGGIEAAGSSQPIDAYAALDQLDIELAEQIELLREKRRVIDQLKQELSEAAPVLEASPAIVAHMALLHKYGASSVLSALELEQILLVSGHKEGEKVIVGIIRLDEFIERGGGMDEYVALSNEMMTLPADASDEECESLTRRAAEFFAPVLRDYLERYGSMDEEDGEFEQLQWIIGLYESEIHNDAQKRVTAAILKRISEEIDFDGTFLTQT